MIFLSYFRIEFFLLFNLFMYIHSSYANYSLIIEAPNAPKSISSSRAVSEAFLSLTVKKTDKLSGIKKKDLDLLRF